MKSKKIILLVILLVVIAAIIIILIPKKQKTFSKAIQINPGFREYIAGFSSGIMSSQSTIKIRFTSQHQQEVEPGTLIEDKMFKFDPSIKGKSYWLDNRTIEFRPDNRLPSGTKYKGEFFLNKVFDVSDDLKTFPIEFQTIKQNLLIKDENLKVYNKKNLKLYKLIGALTTADYAENKNIEKILKATQDEKSLSIKWTHDAENKRHEFQVDSIFRREKKGEIELSWNGASIGADISGDRKIKIPGLDDFSIISIKVIQEPDQYVLIQFSDPLESNQNLKGLVSIQGEGNVRYAVNDNEIKLYPRQRLGGSRKIQIERGIKNSLGYKLKKGESKEITFEAVKPAIKLIGKGIIMPNSNGLIFPFETVNLNAIDVKIVKIYENNIAQFLQINTLTGTDQMKRVGRPILKKKIELVADNIIDYGQWNSFSIDLAELIETDPGAIYHVELSFKKEYSLYPCEKTNPDEEDKEDEWDEYDESESSGWDGIESYYYDDYYYYDYYERENPCNKAYYLRKKVARNILASDLGIIAKCGKNKMITVAVSDLRTTEPLSGVKIEILNYQQQNVGEATTGSNGLAQISYDMKPFLLIVKNGDQRGYLKLDDGSSLSLSKFDVSGEVVQKGVKGFLYGERGVWRPGDTLFLTFILEDKQKTLPPDHPITLELFNPMGQRVEKFVKSSGVNNFYKFTSVTDPDAPTGNWTAKIKVGGVKFEKILKIETIKPNRLKIKIDFGVDKLTVENKNIYGNLEVKWLHGAIARNLSAQVDVTLAKTKTTFKKYQDFIFDDPSKDFYTDEITIFDGRVDDNGKAKISANLGSHDQAPGMLKATFVTRVFEEGGDYSIDQFSIPYAPFRSFVGIKVPKGDKARGMLLTDTDHKVEVVTVNADEEPISLSGLEAVVYKIIWRWWWESGGDNLGSYASSTYSTPIVKKSFSTKDGFGSFDFQVKYPDWGRYLIKVTSPGGHSTGKTVYIDWPGWAGRAQRENPGGASMLTFTTDKQNYSVGETVEVSVPSSEGGRALVSIESGSKVLDAYWVETQKELTVFKFEATEKMAPNAYINITMVQPHNQSVNDLPIRLYGITPIFVEDPATKIEPVINMPDELSSEANVKIKVNEKNGKPMTYTLAIVDDGLLDLTRFQTPDPWSKFYAREALGVKTWDIYELVLGAYGGKIECIFGIGGGEEMEQKAKKKAQRFKPVVRYFGPYYIKKDGSNTIEFKMPKYIGSVRAMVVAGNEQAYGYADKTIPVKNPLMILATLPRVLGPDETVNLPVTIFAMDNKIKNVSIEVKTGGPIEIDGNSKKTISFSGTGEKDVLFKLKVSQKLGVGNVKVIAQAGSEKAEYEIEIQVRNPNPPVVETYSTMIQPGENWEKNIELVGLEGTNKGSVEVANIPPINMDRRLKFLIQYPHGCIEQTTSSVFPQLYLDDILELKKEANEKIKTNIEAGIERIKTFQLSSGGFGYWPNSMEASEWGTNYAGHFILEAETQGYSLPMGMKDNWIKFQKEKANNWSSGSTKYRNEFVQAYRVYTLALAKQADLGAMNRLREKGNISIQSKWRLAAAYALAGKTKIAEEIIEGIPIDIEEYVEMSYTYGSSDRDRAMILESLGLLKKYDAGIPVMEKISKSLNSNQWMSTQTTAYCLLAMAKFAGSRKDKSLELKYEFVFNNKSEKIKTLESVSQHNFNLDGVDNSNVSITNNTTGVIYVNTTIEGIPLIGDETSSENNLKMSIAYKDMDGGSIDVSNIEQGTDFKAEVTITNTGAMGDYKEMALSQIFPSGWEIHNIRLFSGGSTHIKDVPTYQDIRDDRVYTYFNINSYQKKTYVVLLNAAYLGRYYSPTTYCEAMYDNRIHARKPGQWVEVIRVGQ